jgi:hypothetical protein
MLAFSSAALPVCPTGWRYRISWIECENIHGDLYVKSTSTPNPSYEIIFWEPNSIGALRSACADRSLFKWTVIANLNSPTTRETSWIHC